MHRSGEIISILAAGSSYNNVNPIGEMKEGTFVHNYSKNII